MGKFNLRKLFNFLVNIQFFVFDQVWIAAKYDRNCLLRDYFKFGGNGYYLVYRGDPVQLLRRFNTGVSCPVSPRMDVTGWGKINFD